MMEFYQLGFIRPIVPIKCFKASVPQEAFAYMQKGNHIGKVVISIRNNAAEPDTGNTVTTAKTPHTLNPAASYLLIGGLGGLGRSIALWMVQHGARHLVFLSRSAGQGNAQEEDIVRLLESMDCSVHLVAGSVTDRADVARAISHATTAAPLKGIIQMRYVLKSLTSTAGTGLLCFLLSTVCCALLIFAQHGTPRSGFWPYDNVGLEQRHST